MEDKIKISQLNTLTEELTDDAFVPLIQGGSTWKFAPRTKFVKNTGNETIAGVKTFNSSPIVPAGDATGEVVNYDQLTALDRKHSVVDNTSRVAEYTGDGIPLIPDNAAGRTYFQDAWATTDGWTAAGSGYNTLAVSGGRLIGTVISGQTGCVLNKAIAAGTQKEYVFRVICSKSVNINIYAVISSVNTLMKTFSVIAGIAKNESVYIAGDVTNFQLSVAGVAGGDTMSLDWVYIGTGAYDTPAKDRAGNGNSLALTAVTPVNGKYGKEMAFNGSTSYAQASSPVIGTTGTVTIRLKPASLTANLRPFGTRRPGLPGGVAGFINLDTGVFAFTIVKADASVQAVEAGTVSTSYYTAFTFTWDGTTIKTYREGILVNSVSQLEPATIAIDNLVLGRTGTYGLEYFNGIISHFRYDSRVWTADEALAWSLNPISVDSRV